MNIEKKLELKRRELALTREKSKQEYELPHLFRKHYVWSRQFYDSQNRLNIICSANQIGKSSVAIRRNIADATDSKRWKMWPTPPKMFWYFYPDIQTVIREFETKWQEWLPRGQMKMDKQYGWKPLKTRGDVSGVQFNSGVVIYFMTYTKKPSAMQAGTVHQITCDEELPVQLYDELILRLTRTNGIFNSVFTPTLNQEFWREAVETNRRMPTALKLQVSMYDCLLYEDGTQSEFFTDESIGEVISKCRNEAEINRRVYGKFVADEGRMYYAYEPDKHMIPKHDVSGWHIAASVDYGSGGSNHPAAIIFLAVKPNQQEGRVFLAWRGDNGQETTAGDIFEKYQIMRKNKVVMTAVYDPGAKDFGTIAERCGESFIKADKSRVVGEELVNTLFRNNMLKLFDDDPEIAKLSGELIALLKSGPDNKKLDDLADALRYVCMAVNWDWTVIEEKYQAAKEPPKPMTEAELIADQIRMRRGETIRLSDDEQSLQEFNDEIEEWNSYYG